MMTLQIVFCVIGIVGSIFFGAALVRGMIDNRPVNVEKLAREYLEK